MDVGDEIRSKKIVQGVRVGSAEVHKIVALTAQFVIYEIFGSDGRCFGERVIPLKDFASEFELVPEKKEFFANQMWRTSTGAKVVIRVVDSVRVGDEDRDMIAYMYIGGAQSHIRLAEDTEGWEPA